MCVFMYICYCVTCMCVCYLDMQVETDDSKKAQDRPIVDVRILNVNVFVNPFNDAQKAQEEEDEKERLKQEEENTYKEELGSWFSNPVPSNAQPGFKGVGKYMPSTSGDDGQPPPKRPRQ